MTATLPLDPRTAADAGASRDLAPAWLAVTVIIAAHGAAVACQMAGAYFAHLVATIVEGLVYAAIAWAVVHRRLTLSVPWILGVAVLMRLSVLFMLPYHSTDIFRYIWDGRVQAAGINPYLHVPNDPALTELRDSAIWPFINRADYAPTIYPPVSEMLFFLITRVSETLVWMKTALVLFEAVTVGVLLKLLDAYGLPRARILLYAWCPLPIWEFAGGGHVDAAMAMFVVLALLMRQRERDGLVGATLGLAVLVKFFPLVLAPALWRRWDWRLPAAGLATLVVGYLVYISAGWHVFGFLTGYFEEEGIEDGDGFWIMSIFERISDADVPSIVYPAAAALVMAGLGLWVASRAADPRTRMANCLALAAAAMVLLSPEYPWYFCWLTPFLCFVPSAPVIWLTIVSCLLYWDDPHEVYWINDVLYGGLIVIAACDIARRRWPLFPQRSLA